MLSQHGKVQSISSPFMDGRNDEPLDSYHGYILWWNHEKNFGRITFVHPQKGNSTVFIHTSAISGPRPSFNSYSSAPITFILSTDNYSRPCASNAKFDITAKPIFQNTPSKNDALLQGYLTMNKQKQLCIRLHLQQQTILPMAEALRKRLASSDTKVGDLIWYSTHFKDTNINTSSLIVSSLFPLKHRDPPQPFGTAISVQSKTPNRLSPRLASAWNPTPNTNTSFSTTFFNAIRDTHEHRIIITDIPNLPRPPIDQDQIFITDLDISTFLSKHNLPPNQLPFLKLLSEKAAMFLQGESPSKPLTILILPSAHTATYWEQLSQKILTSPAYSQTFKRNLHIIIPKALDIETTPDNIFEINADALWLSRHLYPNLSEVQVIQDLHLVNSFSGSVGKIIVKPTASQHKFVLLHFKNNSRHTPFPITSTLEPSQANNHTTFTLSSTNHSTIAQFLISGPRSSTNLTNLLTILHHHNFTYLKRKTFSHFLDSYDVSSTHSSRNIQLTQLLAKWSYCTHHTTTDLCIAPKHEVQHSKTAYNITLSDRKGSINLIHSLFDANWIFPISD